MAFIDQTKVIEIEKKITSDLSFLGKVYKAKKNSHQTISIDHSLVDSYIKVGWEEYTKPLKTKTKLRKPRSHSKQFEDDVWCQFYELGYRTMNFDESLSLYFSNNSNDKKQIDVIAINNDTAFIIECKSSEKFKKAPSYKDEFELLGLRLDGFKKVLHQIYGRNLKIKYVFATRNLRIDKDSEDMKRFNSTNSFLYNNNIFNYINSLIKNYKGVAFYQFLGLVFKNELISKDRIEIPAIKGEMGTKSYYMFSLEPSLLLKMGFILHRTKVNESELPTYQRLLVPSRLSGITKFIDEGGYFPNSIIINFSNKKHKIQFEASSKASASNSCFGTLKVPNSYGIAYIIDGQHRVYGYANSNYKNSNTIPVVAFDNLDTSEQLKIFMDINENQKAVSPSLRLDLEEDLYWNSDRADSRIKALRSSIIKKLANSQSSPLFEKISVGEDKAVLAFKPFSTALSYSDLLPSAKGNHFSENAIKYSLYNVSNHDHNKEMYSCQKRIVSLLTLCYDFVEQDYSDIYYAESSFIFSNRGTFAFICLIGNLHRHLIDKALINKDTDIDVRFTLIKSYLSSLLEYLRNKMTDDEKEKQLSLLGAGADIKWLRFFQSIINKSHLDYYPTELIDWNERQDEELQNKGRTLGVEIEKKMKALVLNKMKTIYVEDWELEINSIKRECQNRAEQEMEKHYKEGLGRKTVHWTEMFNINDYKTIIEKYWTKLPEQKNGDFKTFEKDFAIDVGEGLGSKSKSLKWISFFNSYRNLWAHEGTKEKRLNKEEVNFIEKIHSHFYN
ncbi:DGQHR domain-containing protein [Pontibacter diazotrophicus]|uniref:DGQHR domain-containing protein n=1 Tax=Pontibacter diazotrophicus TaxID=1400979 RepID=A0A3D8L6E0_9BACT|nr:DGQHR domain-containing protein [Pontibacter diazotrophicus]RDV12959.1 DGQHR domain-containing protein [Pontibacter diazotrophicus]